MYNMRDAISSTVLSEYVHEENEKDLILSVLKTEEDWLYTDEGYDGMKKTFNKRLNDLKEKTNVFEKRKVEHLGRDDSISSIRKSIHKYKDIANNVNTKDEEKYSHLTDDQRKQVNEKVRRYMYSLKSIFY